MFANTRRNITLLFRLMRGENLTAITKESNKQIQKLEKVIKHLDQDAAVASVQALNLRNAAIAMDNHETQLIRESAKTSVLKDKLDSLFTVTESEVNSKINSK